MTGDGAQAGREAGALGMGDGERARGYRVEEEKEFASAKFLSGRKQAPVNCRPNRPWTVLTVSLRRTTSGSEARLAPADFGYNLPCPSQRPEEEIAVVSKRPRTSS